MLHDWPVPSAVRTLTIAGLALVLLVFCQAPAHAAPDPAIDWELLETPHFAVIYDSKHYQAALRYAQFAEQAYAVTIDFFKEAPAKTVLVVDESTDLANGMATGLPYPQISAYPVLPTALDSISDYGNWGLELLTHEYTHILTFEPAHGLARPLRWIFGNILRPNMALPRWYLEGLAVQMETRLSSHGRLRSRNAMAVPRAMVEADALKREDIARINEIEIPDALGGLRPYLLGGILWNHMVATAGDAVIADLNVAYSRRMPFFINGPAESRFGLNYTGLLNRSYETLYERANAQIERVRANNELVSKELPQIGIFNHSPAISPDGNRLVFISRTTDQDDRIELLERPAGASTSFSEIKRRGLTTGMSINRAAWLPDSTGFIFDKVDTFDRYYTFADLYHYDLTSKKTRRLSRGLRAREPVVSPDGTRIAFVQITENGTRLAQVDRDGGNFKVLYEPSEMQIRVSRPEFMDATRIIFSEKPLSGQDTLMVLDGTEAPPRAVLEKYQPATFPRMTSEGLLFVSGISGIDNLYLADGEMQSARPVSNVATRAMTGEVDTRTRELYLSRLGADGPRIHVATKDAWLDKPQYPPQIEPLLSYQWPAVETRPAATFEPQRQSYSAWPYMLPRYWMPFFYFIPEGTYFSAATGSTDPLGKHAYSLEASYDTLSRQPSFAGQYINMQTRVAYSLQASDSREFIYSGDFVRHTTSGMVSGSFDLSAKNSKWKGALGWSQLQTELASRIAGRGGPRAVVSYTDVSQRGKQISPERGGLAMLAHTRFLPEVGSLQYEVTDFLSQLYFSKWLPQHHAFALNLNASIAPRMHNVFLGQTTSGANYGSLLLSNAFLMRGYGNGSFIGRNIFNGSLEYRFPISYEYRGFGTAPAFIKRWHGAAFVDAVTLDGAWFDNKYEIYRRASLGRYYLGYGLEARADLNLFYYLPVRAILGLYYGADQRAGLGLTPYIGFSL